VCMLCCIVCALNCTRDYRYIYWPRIWPPARCVLVVFVPGDAVFHYGAHNSFPGDVLPLAYASARRTNRQRTNRQCNGHITNR
jgi:hypothetical protein